MNNLQLTEEIVKLIFGDADRLLLAQLGASPGTDPHPTGYSWSPVGAGQKIRMLLDHHRPQQAPRLRVETSDLEVDKPQGGGGKGKYVLYVASLVIDGVHACSLRTSDMKKPGQLQALVDIVKGGAL